MPHPQGCGAQVGVSGDNPPMPTTGLASVREVRSRQPLAPASFNLVAGLGATTLAVALLLLGLLVTDVPARSFSIVFFAWAPTGAAAALPIVLARARRDRDPMLGWFAAGLLVCLVAMVLQVLSLPTVSPDGGALETDHQGNAALYLLFHLALYLAALAAAVRLPGWLAGVFSAAGVVLAFAFARNLVPLPELLVPATQDYTELLIGLEVLIALVGVVALIAWSRVSGSPTTPLRAWIGLALLLSVLELALNAVAAARYDPMWWSSLSLRLATFGLLAAGCVWTVVRDLARVERYSEVELGQRDREIRGMVAVTDLLLANAQRLGRCHTTDDVAVALDETLSVVTGVTHTSVAVAVDGSPRLVSDDRAADVDWEHAHRRVLEERASLWWNGPEEVDDPLGPSVGALAGLPLEVSGELAGSLVVATRTPRRWGPADRELLTGVADQAGQALVRTQLAERDRDAALTLQDALAPTAPPDVGGLQAALRYVPATTGTRVGGDWVDCWELEDGRVALVVGDVVGKGLAAAATMGRLRAAIRALVRVDPAPSVVLGRLDDLESEHGSQMVATVLYALLDRLTGQVAIGRAGHLPLAVVHPDGLVELVREGGSTPIGVGDGARPDVVVKVRPGAALVLYTDGLIERRGESLAHGLEGLHDALATPYAGAEQTADALMGLAPADAADDIALLVVFTEAADTPQAEDSMSHQTHLPEPVE
jgi:Stage II sporulation protein E (SpoIIE)/GAF domain